MPTGGYSLLRLTAAGKLAAFQHSYFRAGQAHAGVLLMLAARLVCVLLLAYGVLIA